MESKFNLLSLISYLCLRNFASSLKYEHISDCRFYNISITPGIDNVTYICAGNDNEKAVFLMDSKQIKCSNSRRESNIWPGTIDFQNCRFPTMTRNYFEMFENMHTFIISNVELETMQMNIFREAKNVSKLDISQNKLVEIPSLIFFNAINLKYVDFSNNTIKRVDPMAFEGATNLLTLNLSHNQINELDSCISKLPNLLTLDISNNNISKLHEHAFDKLINLKQLNLSYNAIGNLDIKTFSYLINLEDLNLKQTNLSNIQLGTFSQQHKLVSLDLSENSLKKLDFKLFIPILRDLRSLYLGKNQLKDLNGFRNTLFPQLNSLDIQVNQFSCAYLTNFMDSVNWEKIHLYLDVNSIDKHQSNIRGIGCDDSQERKTEETSFLMVDELQSAQISQGYKDASTIQDYNDAIMKMSLVFLCVAFTIYIILFTVANLNQIHSQLAKPLVFYRENRKHLTEENVVEFTNEGILIT